MFNKTFTILIITIKNYDFDLSSFSSSSLNKKLKESVFTIITPEPRYNSDLLRGSSFENRLLFHYTNKFTKKDFKVGWGKKGQAIRRGATLDALFGMSI